MGFTRVEVFFNDRSKRETEEKQNQEWLLNMDLFELCFITSVEVSASLDFLCISDSCMLAYVYLI